MWRTDTRAYGGGATLAPVTEKVQVLRGGQARVYLVAEEREDGSLLLEPEPVPVAKRTDRSTAAEPSLSPRLRSPGSSRFAT